MSTGTTAHQPIHSLDHPLFFLQNAGISLTEYHKEETSYLKLVWLGDRFIEQGLQFALQVKPNSHQKYAASRFEIIISTMANLKRTNGVLDLDDARGAIAAFNEDLRMYATPAVSGLDFIDICVFNMDIWKSADMLELVVDVIIAQLDALQPYTQQVEFVAWLHKILKATQKRLIEVQAEEMIATLAAQDLPPVNSANPMIQFIEMLAVSGFPAGGAMFLRKLLLQMGDETSLRYLARLAVLEIVARRQTEAILGVNNQFFGLGPIAAACLPDLDQITAYVLESYGIEHFGLACIFTFEMWNNHQQLDAHLEKVETWKGQRIYSQEVLDLLQTAIRGGKVRVSELKTKV